MARQLRVEYPGCTWATGKILAPSYRPGEDLINEDEWKSYGTTPLTLTL